VAVRFRDRTDAGRELARELARYAGAPRTLVLALPRGGVPVAYEVAEALGLPLDVFVVRKLGVPHHEELAMGAIATGDTIVLNDDVVQAFGVREHELDQVIETERRELDRRERSYRGDLPPLDVRGATVILIDDGLATGATMRAAIAALGRQAPERIVVAVPTAAAETCAELRAHVDEVVCAFTPEPFQAVGLWYEDFSQNTDEEVHELLERARRDAAKAGRRWSDRAISIRAVSIPAAGAGLAGDLVIPDGAHGIVVFAHGSGSSRKSPRNVYVAEMLQQAGLATLLMDLLTLEEEAVDARTRHLRFDIDLLAERLVAATDWLTAQRETRPLRIGYFGASTGAAAALVAAARRPNVARAVVSRGGRPDLAGDALGLVRAPTLLIVGSRDEAVIRLNETAMARIRAPVTLTVIPGATHLFEEAGTLEEVARLSSDWLRRHLSRTHDGDARDTGIRDVTDADAGARDTAPRSGTRPANPAGPAA
jgi:putative phosphoribosyl transferase